MSLVAYQKQFVLGPLPVSVRADWRTIRIADGLVLSRCPKLRIERLQSKDGAPYWLVGIAVRADEPMSAIAEGFPLWDSAEIENWSGFWAGRWFLISPQRCWQDHTGCFGIFHRRVGTGFWISNSAALLGDHLPGAPSAARLPWHIVDNKGIDWIPLPFSTREGIYRLLTLRTIEPQTGRITPLRFAAPPLDAGGDVQAIACALKTIMTNWAQAGFRERFIALTAGIDTRSILAAAIAAKIDFETFTTWFPITKERDLRLPPRIAARVGVPYALRRLPAIDARETEARMAAITEHMDGTGWHRATMYIAGHAYDLLTDQGQTVAHGNVMAGEARGYYWAKFSNAGREAPPTDPDHILDSFTFRSSWRPEPRELWRRAFRAWIESLQDPLPLAQDWRDRFYLEQRAGGWNATTQAFWDMLDGTAFYPGNCLWMTHLFLRFSPGKRKQGVPQREAIHLLAPELLEFPTNPKPIPIRLRETVRDLLGPRIVRVLKSLASTSRLRRVHGGATGFDPNRPTPPRP
jgi:hypothetical protein